MPSSCATTGPSCSAPLYCPPGTVFLVSLHQPVDWLASLPQRAALAFQTCTFDQPDPTTIHSGQYAAWAVY